MDRVREYSLLKQVSKKNPIWQAIAHEMLAMGYDRQPEACKSMWKAFGLEYKACKDQNKKSGSKRMTMQQLQIIDDMLGEKESTAPSFLFSTGAKNSATMRELLTEEEAAMIHRTQHMHPRNITATEKFFEEEKNTDPEGPYNPGVPLNRKQRRLLEKDSEGDVLDVSGNSNDGNKKPSIFTSRETSAEKIARSLTDKIHILQKEYDEKMRAEKIAEDLKAQQREMNEARRFREMMQMQVMQHNSMMKMMAFSMNPNATPEQLAMFSIPMPSFLSSDGPSNNSSNISTVIARPVVPHNAMAGIQIPSLAVARAQDQAQISAKQPPICEFPACKAAAVFGFPNCAPMFCSEHKVDGMK